MNRQLNHQTNDKDNIQRLKTKNKYLKVFLKKFKFIKEEKNQSLLFHQIKIRKQRIKVFFLSNQIKLNTSHG
jgi:hypothetical protein